MSLVDTFRSYILSAGVKNMQGTNGTELESSNEACTVGTFFQGRGF